MISTHKIFKTAVINLQTDLNNKAETSLSNLSPEGKHYVAFKGYDSIASYSLNDVVASIQNNEVKIYQSLVDNNTSSLSDTTKWKEVSLGGGNVIILQQTSGTFTLETNKNYMFSVSGESSISIAEPINKTIINQTFIEMQLQSVVAVNWGDVLFVNGEAPDISTVGTYMVYYQWSLGGNKWLVGAYKVGA